MINASPLLVLQEYRGIDFVLFDSKSISNARLAVDTVIEVKSNYATQVTEIQNRIPLAQIQANDYLTDVNAHHAYVLYLVAAPCINQKPKPPCDNGWRYWNSPCPATAMQIAINNIGLSAGSADMVILGNASNGQDQLLYCALLECTVPAVSTAQQAL